MLRNCLLQKQHALGNKTSQLTHHVECIVRTNGSSLVPPRMSEFVPLREGTSKKYAGILRCRSQTLTELQSPLQESSHAGGRLAVSVHACAPALHRPPLGLSTSTSR